MRSSWRWLLIPLLFIPGAAIEPKAATAQDVELKSRNAPAVPPESTAGRISLDVQVTDAKGQPVRGLQEQDFTVLDDKQRQKIVSFHAVTGETASSPEPPVAIVLVVDAVNTSPSTLGYVRDGLDKFLLRNDGRLVQPMSLLFFSREGTAMPPDSSRDGKALAALCDRYQAGLASLNNRSQGLYGDGERFDMSLRYLSSLVQYEQPRPGRKLVLWFSHGWPMLTSPAFQFSSRNR